MKKDQELREQTNPTFATARMTARYLADGGSEAAERLIARLGIPREAEKPNPIETWSRLVVIARYDASDAFIAAFPSPTVVDLPCGFTPRGLEGVYANRRYLGLDLPAVIDAMKIAVPALLDDEGNTADVSYRGADATNYASVRAALEGAAGPLCITTEGLLTYLTDTELDEMCDVMHRVLEEFGGVWATPDPDMAPLTLGVLKAALGEEALRSMRESAAGLESMADGAVVRNAATVGVGDAGANGTGAVEAYFESQGFAVERRGLLDYLEGSSCFADVPAASSDAVRKAFGDASLWLMSVPEGAVVSPEDSSARLDAKDFIVEAEWAGTTLRLGLQGRLDSISAPELLDFYDHQTKLIGPKDVVVDAADLAYISSAGIRTLLIFAKRVGEGHVVVLHADDFMRRVLDETGAAAFLGIE